MLKNFLTKFRKPKVTEKIETVQVATSQSVSPEFNDQLTYAPTTVGFIDTYSQEHTYTNVLKTITKTDSIIDFGCGRGDLYGELLRIEGNTDDYIGIEASNVLSEIGKSKYPNINIVNSDWFALDPTIIKDWAVAVSSFDVVYAPKQASDPYGYLCDTIDVMLNHAKKGVILTFLQEDYTLSSSNILSYDFGIILNRNVKNYNFILDASSIPNTYKLIILKPYEY